MLVYNNIHVRPQFTDGSPKSRWIECCLCRQLSELCLVFLWDNRFCDYRLRQVCPVPTGGLAPVLQKAGKQSELGNRYGNRFHLS